MIYTVESLLTELGAELPLVNGEEHRRSVLRAIRMTMQRIGFQFTAVEDVEEFTVMSGYINDLPDYVLDVLDAGFSADRMEAMQFGRRVNNSNRLYFVQTPFGIQFPNYQNGNLFLTIERLPVDKDGNTLIDERAYEAVYSASMAALLTKFPQHPRFGERLVIKNETKDLIDEARAQYAKRGRRAHNRAINKYS